MLRAAFKVWQMVNQNVFSPWNRLRFFEQSAPIHEQGQTNPQVMFCLGTRSSHCIYPFQEWFDAIKNFLFFFRRKKSMFSNACLLRSQAPGSFGLGCSSFWRGRKGRARAERSGGGAQPCRQYSPGSQRIENPPTESNVPRKPWIIMYIYIIWYIYTYIYNISYDMCFLLTMGQAWSSYLRVESIQSSGLA